MNPAGSYRAESGGRDRRPCVVGSLTPTVPAIVRGPVDRRALGRLAAIRAGW
jgi:hypothetical protein